MKVTKEQIKEWKEKHGELFQVTVEGKGCILRKPNRQDLSYASVVKDPIKMSETLLHRRWRAMRTSRPTTASSWLW